MAVAEADFLTQTREKMDARLSELAPLHAEYERLRTATEALDAIGAAGSSGDGEAQPVKAKSAATRTRAPRATRRAETNGSGAGAAKRGRGRPKGSGNRGAEAVAIVSANPGIKIPQIAEIMGIKQNYLYRVLPSLAEEGKVEKTPDGGWIALVQAADATEEPATPMEA
jgi:hypothetical protein